MWRKAEGRGFIPGHNICGSVISSQGTKCEKRRECDVVGVVCQFLPLMSESESVRGVALEITYERGVGLGLGIGVG